MGDKTAASQDLAELDPHVEDILVHLSCRRTTDRRSKSGQR
jgi:hypothetical protein